MTNTKLRGFGSLKTKNPERLREIASKGGKEAHRLNRSHKWSKEEAAEAGRKSGVSKRNKKPSGVI